MRSEFSNRKAFTAVLAMLYLVMFATLALGFYASSNTVRSVSENERRSGLALASGESGMNFMNYHLAQLSVPHLTPQANLINEVYNQLNAQIGSTANLGGKSMSLASGVIEIPAGSNNYIRTDSNGSGFRVKITQVNSLMRVKVIGRHGNAPANRAIQMDFNIQQNPSPVFNYGVASRSAISLNSNAKITGSTPTLGGLLITTNLNPALTMLGNATITGDVSFSQSNPSYTLSNTATIAGFHEGDPGFDDHVHTYVEEPEFPTVDTRPFRPWAGNPAYGGITVPPAPVGGEIKYDTGTIRNVLIRANPGGGTVVFSSNLLIDGVIFIETPNKVRFDGNVVIRGCVVVENSPKGDYNSNLIEFTSTSKIQPIESLPDTDPRFPMAMQSLKGSAILAPGFTVTMNSNFGTTGGSLIADKIKFDSNAFGNITGSVVNLSNTAVSMDGNAAVTIQSLGAGNAGAGLFFSKHYSPVANTYEEVPAN